MFGPAIFSHAQCTRMAMWSDFSRQFAVMWTPKFIHRFVVLCSVVSDVMCNLFFLFLRRPSGNLFDSSITFCCWYIVQFVLAGALNAHNKLEKEHDGCRSLRGQSGVSFSRVLAEVLKNWLSIQHGGIFRAAELRSEILTAWKYKNLKTISSAHCRGRQPRAWRVEGHRDRLRIRISG